MNSSALLSAVTQTAEPQDERLSRVYKTVGERQLKLFIENPPAWKASDKRPALVFFHGGGWKGGAVRQFAPHSQHFAARGLVCIQVQYRTLGERPDAPTELRRAAVRRGDIWRLSPAWSREWTIPPTI